MSRILTEREVNQYSPLALAFLGDSVYEKLVRECIVLSANMPASKLHDLKVKKVCASFQSEALDKIMPLLDTKEIAIVKRGRNATGNTVPKSSNAIDIAGQQVWSAYSVIWICLVKQKELNSYLIL